MKTDVSEEFNVRGEAMGEPRCVINAKCIDCGAVDEEMWRVGAFFQCRACLDIYFPDEYDPRSEDYKDRLEKVKKLAE